MNALQQDAQAASTTAASRPGNSTTLMTSVKAKLEAAPGFLTPIEFEKQILGWKHTQRVLAQAASKQPKKQAPYPPQGIAS